MADNFKTEIIIPEKIIYSDNVECVTLPSYEGNMSILKDHITIITFLRPGIIRIEKNNNSKEEFFIQDGTIEFFNNNLSILSSFAVDIKKISKEFIDQLNKDTENKLLQKDLTDHDRYILNHKLEALREVRI